MKIVFFTGTLDYGGAEKHALLLADYYKNHLNWDVELWGWSRLDGPMNDLAKGINVKVRHVPMFRLDKKHEHSFWRRIKYIRFINKLKIDVVMSFNNRPNIFCAYILPKTNVKSHIWAQQGIDGYKFPLSIEQKALRNLKCIISNSINGSNFLQEIGVPKNKIEVVYNGINTNLPTIDNSDWVNKLNFTSEKTFNAIMVANITTLKDHITLVKAWKIVSDELMKVGITAHLYLAGRKDNQVEDTEKEISNLGLENNIHILGVVMDVFNLVSLMDLSILSSPSEGLPNAVLECMLLEKAFVGTNIEGIREAVGPDNFQYLSEYKDENGLANNILKFALNKELLLSVGIKNKKWVEEQFPIQKLWEKTHAIVKKTISLIPY